MNYDINQDMISDGGFNTLQRTNNSRPQPVPNAET